MEVVTRTGEYTIYKKRNQRYAVRKRNKQWVRGDDKVAILLAHELVVTPPQPAPEAAPPEAEAPADTDTDGGDEAGAEAAQSGEAEAAESDDT